MLCQHIHIRMSTYLMQVKVILFTFVSPISSLAPPLCLRLHPFCLRLHPFCLRLDVSSFVNFHMVNLTKSCFTESCFTEGTVQNTYNCPIIDAFGCYLWKAIVAPEASNRGTPKYGIQNIKSFNSDFASLSLYDLNKSLSHRSLKPGTWCCGLHCVIHSRTRARQTMQKCTPNLYCILT